MGHGDPGVYGHRAVALDFFSPAAARRQRIAPVGRPMESDLTDPLLCASDETLRRSGEVQAVREFADFVQFPATPGWPPPWLESVCARRAEACEGLLEDPPELAELREARIDAFQFLQMAVRGLEAEALKLEGEVPEWFATDFVHEGLGPAVVANDVLRYSSSAGLRKWAQLCRTTMD